MGFTRRDLLTFTGGSAAGLLLTPVPWSLLRDTAVLSENWPGVPQPSHGEIRTRYTTCMLCPAGCGVRARCVGDRPVSLAGVPGHPASRGVLCPTGLVGHHLAFCRDRAAEPLANGKPVAIERALAAVSAAIAACGPRDSVAILDPRPGRAASLVYRRFLAGLPKAVHCAPSDSQPYGPFGIDLENTRAILSFGAPVLDGWLSPGRVLANRSHLQLIQVEPAYSRTASLADLWVPVLPGGQETFPAAVARALKGEDADASATEVARILLRNKPAIAIGGGAAVAKLNAVLASVGRPGGFLPRRDFTLATDIAAVPDGSIRVLLIEEAAGANPLPWDLLRRKLVPQNPVVVALTPWLDGCAQHADYVIPAPMYLESLDEAPTPAGSTVASFSLSPALLTAPPKLTQPAEFVLRLAHDSATYPEILKQRVAAIEKDRRGALFTYADGKSKRVRDIASAGDLWKAMLGGAVWLDDPLLSPRGADPLVCAGPPGPALPTPQYPLILIPADTPPQHGSPLMSKLYRESGLRRSANAATVHPETGRDHALTDGCRAVVKSPTGAFPVQVIFDPAVMPGVIEMAGQGLSPASIRRA
jgi:menaquinone reductase, molybdopterin-binding-like subunit